MAEGLVITKGQEHCLYVLTLPAFREMSATVSAAPITDREARNYARVLFSSGLDQTPDKQGRITVPLTLRAYAGLDRECVVIGAGARLEIWDSAAWNTFLAVNEASYAEIDDRTAVLPV